MSDTGIFLNYDGNASDYDNKRVIEYFRGTYEPEMRFSLSCHITGTFKAVLDIILLDYDRTDKNFVYYVINEGNITVHNDKLLLTVSIDNENPYESIERECQLSILGKSEEVEKTYKRLDIFKTADSYVYWWFKTPSGMRNSCFTIKQDKKIYNEHYPWLGNVDEYINRFMVSNENILILLGDPGTGKTSFLRYMLTKTGKNSYVSYDEEVMGGDELYITFMTVTDVNFLVLEDADLLLTERIHDNNRVMSKILNASDGLVYNSNKKFVFTANIRDEEKIDEALRRPGRCFDIVRFRPLTPKEAMAVAKVNNLELSSRKNEYTLAEIFNKGNN